jgi:CRP-like cAMP-binding protein
VVAFARGEEMQPFGDTIPDFVLIAAGRATLLAADAEGRPVRIADLGPGDFYGEATISASRPSEFRVVADTDVTAVAFDAGRFSSHLQRSGGLAAEVGDALESRRRAAQALRRRKPADERAGVS